jgi:hypothetical protein
MPLDSPAFLAMVATVASAMPISSMVWKVARISCSRRTGSTPFFGIVSPWIATRGVGLPVIMLFID